MLLLLAPPTKTFPPYYRKIRKFFCNACNTTFLTFLPVIAVCVIYHSYSVFSVELDNHVFSTLLKDTASTVMGSCLPWSNCTVINPCLSSVNYSCFQVFSRLWYTYLCIKLFLHGWLLPGQILKRVYSSHRIFERQTGFVKGFYLTSKPMWNIPLDHGSALA